VLVVDDRQENLDAFEAVLAPLGHRIVRANSSAEALRLLLKEDFAVVLLDVRMPGTDGVETARLIKSRIRSRSTPIIFITALEANRRQVSEAYSSGAVDYLFKPIDPDMLRAKVGAFLELYEKREQLAWLERRRYADLVERESQDRILADRMRARWLTARRARSRSRQPPVGGRKCTSIRPTTAASPSTGRTSRRESAPKPRSVFSTRRRRSSRRRSTSSRH
jgi:CheY-like chemotaxis protein